MRAVDVLPGDGPIVLCMPHGGMWLPEYVSSELNENGKILADTDWHIAQLYKGLAPGATIIRANFHRYLIDANRDPSGLSLYPGQNTTGLLPRTDFDGKAIWKKEWDEAEIALRIERYHRPYHQAIEAALAEAHARHGVALLYDCHSIRSEIPFLFEGKLPDLNIGSNSGQSCAPQIETEMHRVCASSVAFSTVLNGRFKGGWTTRHYGRPDQGIHAVQMEISQKCYLAEEQAPFRYDPEIAKPLRTLLMQLLAKLLETAFLLGGNHARFTP